MTDDRDRAAGGDLEVDAVQDRAPRVVAEAHVLEAHARPARDERLRAGPVLYVLPLVEQAEQPLHVGQRLLDLAVHHAEERERRGELQQVGVHEHEVADRELAGDDADARRATSSRSRRSRPIAVWPRFSTASVFCAFTRAFSRWQRFSS